MGSQKTIIIACGGTGGHLTPGMAVGECLKEAIPHTEIFYLFSGKEIEDKFKSDYRLRFITLRVKRNYLINLPLLILQTISILKRIKPMMVLGFGSVSGFVSVLCARIMGIPSFLFEQNTIMGRANRLASLFARRVFLSFPLVREMKSSKFLLLGNPIRKKVKMFKERNPVEIRRDLGLDLDKFTFLIMGGSQGSYSLNKFMLKNVDKFFKRLKSIQIIHITGKHLFKDLKEKYDSLKIKNFVTDFYSEMGKLYRVSDFAISRAGATSIFELAYFGIPSIFVPYPYAVDNHQYFNALYIKENNAGFVLEEKDLNFESAIGIISSFYESKKKREELSNRFNQLLKIPECSEIVNLFKGILQ